MNIASMANEAGFIRQRSLLHLPSRLVAFLRQYFPRFLSPIFSIPLRHTTPLSFGEGAGVRLLKTKSAYRFGMHSLYIL